MQTQEHAKESLLNEGSMSTQNHAKSLLQPQDLEEKGSMETQNHAESLSYSESLLHINELLLVKEGSMKTKEHAESLLLQQEWSMATQEQHAESLLNESLTIKHSLCTKKDTPERNRSFASEKDGGILSSCSGHTEGLLSSSSGTTEGIRSSGKGHSVHKKPKTQKRMIGAKSQMHNVSPRNWADITEAEQKAGKDKRAELDDSDCCSNHTNEIQKLQGDLRILQELFENGLSHGWLVPDQQTYKELVRKMELAISRLAELGIDYDGF